MARFWGLALMVQAALALSPRVRDAMRSVVDVVDNGVASTQSVRRAETLATKDGLRCFQITNPVMTPQGLAVDNEVIDGPVPYSSSCQVTLMDHVFANSYGQPFVAHYVPPLCAFNRVAINFTVVSEGRQYDRLAIMWLGDTEVWRTSTAEPKAHPGIVWTFWKDMTSYLSLWRQPQTLIFDLGNLVNEKYTGSFNATLTATFMQANLQGSQAPPADKIVPVSAGRSVQGRGSAFTYPQEPAQSFVTLPRNIKRAVVAITANGQADEEFWWSNVPNAGVNTWANVTLPGLSSFREVRLRIDGHLAGLSWPFPVVFTGGISPPLHRPLVGLQAFDIREQEIDVTPFLGLLSNGMQHEFTMEVVGEGDAVVPSYWVLSAKIFLWLDEQGWVPAASRPKIEFIAPEIKQSVQMVPNRHLTYQQTIDRELRVTSDVKLRGKVTSKSWSQKFSMTNDGYLKAGGDFQQVEALYEGEDTAGEDEDLIKYYYSAYTYPISTTYQSKAPDGKYSMTLDAKLSQGLQLVTNGLTAFPNGVEPFLYKLYEPQHGSNVKSFRSGHAFFYQINDGNSSGGYGSTRQSYALAARGFNGNDKPEFDSEPLLYSRDVSISNETVTADTQYVYKSEKGTINRQAPSSSSEQKLDDQFAPALTKGGAGSRVFSKEHKAGNNDEVLLAPGPSPSPATVVEQPAVNKVETIVLVPQPTDKTGDAVLPPVEKPAGKTEDAVVAVPEKLADKIEDKVVVIPESPADDIEDQVVATPEKPVDKIEDNVVATPEKPADNGGRETLKMDLKQIKEELEGEWKEEIRKELEDEIRKKLLSGKDNDQGTVTGPL